MIATLYIQYYDVLIIYLQLVDPLTNVQLLSVSGDAPATPLYTTSGNRLRIIFQCKYVT